MNFKVLISVIFAAVIMVAGCSDDETTNGAGGSGGEGGGGDPATVDCDALPNWDAYVVENAPATATDDCTGETFMSGDNNAQRLNARLENADPGDVICMAADTYEMEDTIAISLVEGLTLKGTGPSPDDTLLNFGGPGTGKGIFVQKDNVTIENLWVRNTGDNGIEMDGTTGGVYRKTHVSWTNADQELNGPYGIYPTNSEDVLVEYSQATDAADAGIYLGKSGWADDTTDGGILRYNITARNVAGFEVENSLDVVAHDNLVANNTGGLMPLQQPGAAGGGATPSNTNILMENNRVWCNNHENFATTGAVQIIPVGTGLLILGGDGIEVRNNDVQGNDTIAVAVIGNAFTCDAAGADCPPFSYVDYNPYTVNIFAHDNYFLNNGTNADTESDFFLVFDLLNIGTEEAPTEDVLWDGYIAEGDDDPNVCLGEDFTGTYRDITDNACQGSENLPIFAQCIATNSTTSTDGRLCSPN